MSGFAQARAGRVSGRRRRSAPGLELPQLRIGERRQPGAIEIDEAQTTPAGDEVRRQRIVAEGAAAKMRRQASHIGERIDLDTQQLEARTVAQDLERNAREPQEAGRIGRGDEAVDESGFDLVEIRLDHRDRPGALRLMRRLPLHGRAAVRMVMPWAVRRVIVIMRMIMIMRMAVVVMMMAVMVVMMTHRG